MKENYLAWKVDPRTFDAQWSLRDQMLFLVRFAVLAPSSHNSQPWKFSIKDSTLRLEADRARALPKSDANYRQLFISLGCALKNCLIAADYAGFGATVVYGGEGLDTYAELTLEKKSDHERDPAHLIFAIPRRHTNRNKYATRLPDQAFLTHMSTRVDGETQLFFVDESPEKESLAEYCDYGRCAFSRRAFWLCEIQCDLFRSGYAHVWFWDANPSFIPRIIRLETLQYEQTQ